MFNCSIENELILIEKYQLVPNELFVLKLLLSTIEYEQTDSFIRFIQAVPDKDLCRNCLISLREKGVILKSYEIPAKGETLDIYAIPFNQNFLKTYHKASQVLGKELFNAYPQFAEIKGMLVPLRSVSRHFNSLEDSFRFYAKAIHHNKELHEKVISLVEWAKENNCLNCAMSSFIINNQWNDLEAMRDGGIQGNVNFDINTAI